MVLDIQTLVLVLGTTFTLQAAVLYVLSLVLIRRRGVNLWALGNLMFSLGFVFMFARIFPAVEEICIILGNVLHVVAFTLFYIGSQHFFNKVGNNRGVIIYALVYIFVIFYFTVIDNDLNLRAAIYSLAMIPLVLINGVFLLKNGKSQIRRSSVFAATIFLSLGFLLFLRFCYLIFINPVEDFFESAFIQSVTFSSAISFGLLWTFALVIIVTQKINNELAESRNQFEMIFNTIPDVVSVSAVESGLFRYTNREFGHVTGFTRDDIFGKSVYDIRFWRDANDRKELIHKVKQEGLCTNLEYDFFRKDGSLFTGLVSATLVLAGANDNVLFLIRDISEIKKKEQEIEDKNKQLELLNSEKDKFFSILAHDLRGPFASIVSLTEVMVDPMYSISTERLRQMAFSLHKTALSTNELLENLLEWSGTKRRTKSFTPGESYFSTIMSHTMPVLTDYAENKKITLVNNVSEDLKVFADPYMLQTIIRNLVVNAIKFTAENGQVEIMLFDDNEKEQVFCVKDSGIGMSPAMAESIFKIDTKTTRKGTNGEPSSGLGLLLCKEFVELHKGKIWVESEENKGSRFYFSLVKR